MHAKATPVAAPPSWEPVVTITNDAVKIDDIVIKFKRTIRVPDNKQVSQLPPDVGNFPLLEVKDYANKMSETMRAKGGIFLPMYRKFELRAMR